MNELYDSLPLIFVRESIKFQISFSHDSRAFFKKEESREGPGQD